MPTESSFKETLAKYRRQLESISEPDALLRLLSEMQSYVDGFPDDPNRKICAAHLGKELVDWVAQKQDDVLETKPGKCLMALLEQLLNICHTAQDAIRSFCVARLYNALITLQPKSNSQQLRLRIAGLMSHCPVENGQLELFNRLKRIALKTVQDMNTKGVAKQSQEEGLTLIIEVQRKLLIHAAVQTSTSDGAQRSTVLTLFRELFDTSLALLYRFFVISRPKAHQLFSVVMETMESEVCPDEEELLTLLNDSISYVEVMINLTGDDGEYLKFAKFLSIFAGIDREPYAGCYQLLHQQVLLQQQTNPSSRDVGNLISRLRALQGEHASNPLVVKVAIFLTCHSSAYLLRLPPDVVLANSGAAIELFQSLMPFVRHCPVANVPELCKLCTGSRRHMAERLITAIMQLCIVQAKDAVERKMTGDQEVSLYHFDRIYELVSKKLNLLEQLGCDRKRTLVEHTVRHSVTWVKYALTYWRDHPDGAVNAMEIRKVVQLLVATQNSYKFEFLTDSYLVRLMENCYIERPDCTSAESSAYCWGIVSVRMLKLLLTMRESAGAATNEEDQSAANIIRSIVCCQLNSPEGDPIRSLDTVQLYQHPSFNRHGFTFDVAPTREEKIMIIAKEMALTTKYKTFLARTPWDYFLHLQELGDMRENCLTFGMALYCFSDNDAEKVAPETIVKLCANLTAHAPTNTTERITRSASIGMGYYLLFCALNRETINRMRDVPFRIENFRNDQIDGLFLENPLDHETRLIDHMEAIRENYGDMIAVLNEENFQPVGVIPSVVQIASILDNTARFYQLNHYPHRAVELQMQILLFVSQGREERPLEQFAPLGFLLEQHRETEELIDRTQAVSTPACFQKYAAAKLGPIEKLAKRATILLKSFSGTVERFVNDVPENRKYQFLNLFLGLAVYYGSRGELDQSLDHIRRCLALLPPTESSFNSGEEKEETKPLSSMETIGVVLKGRMSQIIFRLVVEYGLPWPCSVQKNTIPSLSTFLKAMLTRFNDLQKLPNKHTFVVSLATIELTVAVMQHLIVRYDTGSTIEPYVDQLLKFILRRGAGLRLMQVLLLYGHMNADMEKLDRCEVSLRYLHRLLMLQTTAESPDQKKNAKLVESPPGVLLNEKIMVVDQQRQRLPLVSSVPGLDNDCDDERKAVPKYTESVIISSKAWLGAESHTESTEPMIEQYLMFDHSPKCDCRYCRYPVYKYMAFQAATLCARLAALKRRSHVMRARAEKLYQAIADHWTTAVKPASAGRCTEWYGVAYRKELLAAVIRMFVQWGQFLGSLRHFKLAVNAFDRAHQLSETAELKVSVDVALLEEINFNRTTMSIGQKRLDNNHSVLRKRSRSMLEAQFREAEAAGRIDSNGFSPVVMTSLNVEMNKLFLTPKQQSSATQGANKGRGAPPKTVDRVNELIRQAATRRHQLKNTVDSDDPPGPIGTATAPGRSYSASARKPKTVNIFVDSPPGAASRKQIPTTVGKLKVPPSSASVTTPGLTPSLTKGSYKEQVTASGVAASIPTPIAASVKPERSRRAYGKRALLQENLFGDPAKARTPKFKDVLVKSSRTGASESEESKCGTMGKVRRFELNEFPSLSESSDTDLSTPETPQKPKTVQARVNGEFSTPKLNGSFRDALVLGGGPTKAEPSTSLIVLDDSADSRKSDVAIEASFIDNVSTMSTGGKNSALSLKSYSDRKRMLQGSGTVLTPSALSSVSVGKRKTPLLATKTKLRFDDPSPEHGTNDGRSASDGSGDQKDDAIKRTPRKQEIIETAISKGYVSARKINARKRVCQPVNDIDSAKTELSNIAPNQTAKIGDEGNIATRTRQRRKRV